MDITVLMGELAVVTLALVIAAALIGVLVLMFSARMTEKLLRQPWVLQLIRGRHSDMGE